MRVYLLIICIVAASAVYARQKEPIYDSTLLEVRAFSKPGIDSIASLRDFRYEKEPVETPSLWDRFWFWVWDTYFSIMETESGRRTLHILYWAIGLGAIAFFLYKVMRMNRMGLFTGDGYSAVPYRIEDDNIHAIAFETAIREAIAAGDYRLATRLMYLQSLKLLSDKGLINWMQGKTNADYQHELRNTGVALSFNSITRIFEYVWYGNHVLPEHDFEAARSAFSRFQQSIAQL